MTVSLFASFLLLQGCSEKDATELTQSQLQSMIDDSYLSPQIRNLDIIPMVGIQLYLETPEVSLRSDNEPVKFKFKGHFDADIFGSSVTERLPVEISGLANLAYDGSEQAFYFRDIILNETYVDLDVAIFKTLVVSELKKTVATEIANLSIINLDETSPLIKEIAGRPVMVAVNNGKLLLSYMDKASSN